MLEMWHAASYLPPKLRPDNAAKLHLIAVHKIILIQAGA